MTDEPTENEALKLPPSYDSCLAGASVGLPGGDQFVYSLKKLVRFEMMRHQCKSPEAREIITREFIHPGIIFLNDELLDPVTEVEKPIIILPR